MTELNRHPFLIGSGAAVVGTCLTSTASAAPIEPMPTKWDESVDVIVVGSGFAGLAAACEAKKAGAKDVVVLEMMPTPGGNSIINGGIMAVPGSEAQKALNIKDSPALLAEDILREGLGMSYPDKVRTMTEAAYDTYEWTVNELGVEWIPGKVGAEGGHSVPRHLFTTNGSGSEIVNKQLAYAKKNGIPVRLKMYVERIIRDADGRVKGLQIRERYRFPKADSGKVKFIRARLGVVLCHGGFAADVTYRMKFDPKLTDKFATTNQPGATSELWREASRIGGNLVQNDWIQCGPWTSPEEKGFGLAPMFANGAAGSMGLWIDCSTGKRFVNELANRKIRADAVLVNLNMGHVCIAMCDQKGVDNTIVQTRPGKLPIMIERGVVHKFNTLEEMIAKYEIPADALKKSIDDYNKALAKKTGDEMGRYFAPKAEPIGTGPWYCTLLSPKVHHCMGGLETNSLAQVIDISTDEPIGGLYAAGESTGGVHGAVRLGSCAILDCLVYGRIAGKNVAKEKPRF